MKECKAISKACELQSQGQGWTDLNLFQGLQAPREASPVSSPRDPLHLVTVLSWLSLDKWLHVKGDDDHCLPTRGRNSLVPSH